MDIAKIKLKSKKTLNKNLKPLLMATLMIMVLELVCYSVSCFISAKWTFSLLALIVEALFIPGLIKMTIGATRDGKAKIEDLFSSTELFFKYIIIFLILFAMVFVLGLLEAIALRSLMAVMFFNAEISLALSIFLIAFGLLLAVAIMLVTIYIVVSFSQVFFVLVDEPELSVAGILVKSFDMMENYVIEYFYLVVSFIGWLILGLLSLGIIYIFIIPYMLIAMAYFYDHVKKDFSNYEGEKELESVPNEVKEVTVKPAKVEVKPKKATKSTAKKTTTTKKTTAKKTVTKSSTKKTKVDEPKKTNTKKTTVKKSTK